MSQTTERNALKQTLHADGHAPDRAEAMKLYGQFIGSWEGKFVRENADGVHEELPAEVHFGWVLEGRAVQDVWIVPARTAANASASMHGTTLRVYDPKNDLWHITWIDPVRLVYNRMIGRKIGDDIVQEYRGDDGARVQWTFTEIRPDAFHWTARRSENDGKTWKVLAEFFLRRRSA